MQRPATFKLKRLCNYDNVNLWIIDIDSALTNSGFRNTDGEE